jgi:hypothetical protein
MSRVMSRVLIRVNPFLKSRPVLCASDMRCTTRAACGAGDIGVHLTRQRVEGKHRRTFRNSKSLKQERATNMRCTTRVACGTGDIGVHLTRQRVEGNTHIYQTRYKKHQRNAVSNNQSNPISTKERRLRQSKSYTRSTLHIKI